MKEYLDARREIAQRKKHGYQIAKLAKGLEAAFAGGERVVEVRMVDDHGTVLLHAYFTPVRKKLQRFAERLGNLLHAQPFRELDDPWWSVQWKLVDEAAAELEWATRGIIMGPPLISRADNRMHLVAAVDVDNEQAVPRFEPGRSLSFEVKYVDDIPAPGA